MARQSRLNLGPADEISSVLAVYPWWTRRTWRSVPDGPGLSLMDQIHLVCPRWTSLSLMEQVDLVYPSWTRAHFLLVLGAMEMDTSQDPLLLTV